MLAVEGCQPWQHLRLLVSPIFPQLGMLCLHLVRADYAACTGASKFSAACADFIEC
jgi:hypothetical protein